MLEIPWVWVDIVRKQRVNKCKQTTATTTTRAENFGPQTRPPLELLATSNEQSTAWRAAAIATSFEQAVSSSHHLLRRDLISLCADRAYSVAIVSSSSSTSKRRAHNTNGNTPVNFHRIHCEQHRK
ncbi:unnamed protein product [Ceratitis capitata]|uniref:(Mediterranean fruit fly) hypothetical protein n=1 Tax=Ceratitis capitata TaxID=7213 RepID=A0A811UC11_CERCA|nr:unnamed protein product [Ceratitis capitata]